jgi:hypothetical protein
MTDKNKIHSRQVWWCWINNDPFFPKFNSSALFCPLCDMESKDNKPDETWLAYHRFCSNIKEADCSNETSKPE